MKFSHFFIERPIFAMVISIVIVIAGMLAYLGLPTAQYPEIAPPTIQVTASYPGADPKVVAETVATPIEEQVNGVENMLYMSSQSTADGAMTLTVTFALGTNLDIAQVLVQNRVAIANPQLPQTYRPGLGTESCRHREPSASANRPSLGCNGAETVSRPDDGCPSALAQGYL